VACVSNNKDFQYSALDAMVERFYSINWKDLDAPSGVHERAPGCSGCRDTWHFQVDGADTVVRIRPRLTVSTAEAAIDAAISGLGVTCVLSYHVESVLRARGPRA